MNQQDRFELAKYWINKAKTTLDEAEFQIQHLKLNTAVNRIYYASYYAITALLILKQINAKSHSGVKQMLGLHFIKTGIITESLGDFYSNIFDLRQTGDYDAFIVFEVEDVLPLIVPARELILIIEKIILSTLQ